MVFTIGLILALLFRQSAAEAISSARCQFPTKTALDGCPEGTIFVSVTDPNADFTDIQSAINSLANTTISTTILIGKGTYDTQLGLKLFHRANITLLGQTVFPEEFSQNIVEITNSAAIIALPGEGNINTSTLAVDGPPVFTAHNINLSNLWPSTNHSAALAIGVNQGNASFHSVSFKSFQDTLFVDSKANAFFEGCEVRGQTDFIFGQGRAYFNRATIGVRNTGDIPLAGIVAWQGTANTTRGAYISNSKIGLAPDHNTTHDLTGTMALGRPWNNQSVTIYINTFMGSVVNASGFTAWAGKVFDNVTYGEYGSYGPGYNPKKRILSQETLGSRSEGVEKYSIEKVFGGVPSWL